MHDNVVFVAKLLKVFVSNFPATSLVLVNFMGAVTLANL